jgi:hypothetical protein
VPDRQDGELVDDVLARWDARAVDERGVAPGSRASSATW